VVTTEDITVRKRAERALRHREEILRIFVEHSPMAVAMFDREMRYLVASRRFVQDYRLEGQELLGRSHYEVFPEIPERWREVHRRCLAGAVERCAEDPFPRADGTVDWVRWEIHPWREPSGAVGGIIMFTEVVSERKQAEQALAASEAKYRRLYESLMDGFVLVDMDGRIREFNETYRGMLGYDAEELQRSTYRDLTPERWHAFEGRIVREQILPLGYSEVYEKEYRRKDGSLFPVELRTFLLREDGRASGMWAIVRDITERHRIRNELQESDRRKSEFLAVLSHELRNPLAPIRNSLYLLDRAPPGSEQARRAGEVLRRQTGHLARLVDDLIDVTRVSRGKVELRREPADLRDVVRRACDDHRSIFDAGEIALSLLVPAGPVWIDADVTRISQVVGNLLQNAAKFTPASGTVEVAVSVRDGRAVLCVRDDGIGMEPDLVGRAFEPFVQAEHGLARTRGGLGLGLALVKGLVEAHGGTVSASSEGRGRGSALSFELPIAAPPPAARQERVAATKRPGRTVLIVEDNVDAGDSLADVLELHGHRVHLARDGASGIARALELRPDVVLCDIGLPDRDGYEVARTLRADDRLRTTRLVALSGYAQPEDRKRAREAGFDAHLPKPPPLGELEEVIAAAWPRPPPGAGG
jgi:PAS domain S-box-containing protein